MEKNLKAYKLTESNRQLANFFEGIIIDEENSILWSKQDLSLLGCEFLYQKNKSQEQNFQRQLGKRLKEICIFCIFCVFLPFFMILWAIYAVSYFLPYRLKKIVHLGISWICIFCFGIMGVRSCYRTGVLQ